MMATKKNRCPQGNCASLSTLNKKTLGTFIFFLKINEYLSKFSPISVTHPELFWIHRHTNRTVSVTKLSPELVSSRATLKVVPPDTLKMDSLALSVLRFLCKTFSKLLKPTLRKTSFREWFLKSSYIQIKNLYGYKLVRTAKWSELKRYSK